MGSCCAKEVSSDQTASEIQVAKAADAPPEAEAEAPVDVEQAAAPPTEKLTVAMVSARGLRDADWLPDTGKSDCYCTLEVAGKEYKTKVEKDTLTPIWLEETEVEYTKGDRLRFSVYDADPEDRRELLGEVTMESAEYDPEGFNGELELNKTGTFFSKAYLRVKVKLAGRDYPQPPAQEITIEVEKDPTKPVGLDLDTQDRKTLYVLAVNAGPFQAYNENVKPSEQLHAGDVIVRANGVEGDIAKLLQVMKKDAKLKLLVRRSTEVRVVADRRDPKMALGLEFPAKPTGSTLLITAVVQGAFQLWNEGHRDEQVLAGDRIVEVGGKPGTAAELARRLEAGGACQVTLACPARAQQTGWWWGW